VRKVETEGTADRFQTLQSQKQRLADLVAADLSDTLKTCLKDLAVDTASLGNTVNVFVVVYLLDTL